MSTCPDCGRENVPEPAGYVALCGRRVHSNDVPSDDWRERMWVAQRCKEAAERRRPQLENAR